MRMISRKKKRRFMKRMGSVTVFVAMIFVLLASVILATVQSARKQAAQVMVGTSLSMSVDSLLADYDRNLFEDYGVFFLDGRLGEDQVDETLLASRIEEYLSQNLSCHDGAFFTGNRDLYGIETNEIKVTDYRRATDEGGLLWMEEVVSYEKYAKLINLAAEFLDIDTSQSKKSIDVVETLLDIQIVLTTTDRMNRNARNLIMYIDGPVFSENQGYLTAAWAYNPSCAKAFVPGFREELLGADAQTAREILMKHLREYQKDPIALLEEARNLLLMEEPDYEKVDKNLEDLGKLCDRAIAGIQEAILTIEYVRNAKGNLDQSVDQLSETLSGGLGSLVMESFGDCMDELKEYDKVIDEKFVNLDTAYASLCRNLPIIEELKDECENIPEEMTQQQYLVKLARIRTKAWEYDLSDIRFNYDEITKMPPFDLTRILSTFVNVLKEGEIALVLPDGETMSERMAFASGLASTHVNTYASITNYTDLGNAMTKRLIYGEYVMDRFHCFTDHEHGAAMDYEVERVIGGYPTDKMNLTEVVSEIEAIRTVVNLVALLADSAKLNETEGVATSLMEWTDNPAIIKLTQIALIIGWANIESYYDAKILLSGGKLELGKTQDGWQSTLDNVFDRIIHADVERNDSGLTYEMFLRALLFLEPDGARSARTMDLIELERILSGEKDFRFYHYLYSISAKTTYLIRNDTTLHEYQLGSSY